MKCSLFVRKVDLDGVWADLEAGVVSAVVHRGAVFEEKVFAHHEVVLHRWQETNLVAFEAAAAHQVNVDVPRLLDELQWNELLATKI